MLGDKAGDIRTLDWADVHEHVELAVIIIYGREHLARFALDLLEIRTAVDVMKKVLLASILFLLVLELQYLPFWD